MIVGERPAKGRWNKWKETIAGGWKVEVTFNALAAERCLPRAAGSKILEEPGTAISDKRHTLLTAWETACRRVDHGRLGNGKAPGLPSTI